MLGVGLYLMPQVKNVHIDGTVEAFEIVAEGFINEFNPVEYPAAAL